MQFTNARYVSEDRTMIDCDVDGVRMTLPADVRSERYRALIAAGVDIAEASAAVVTADDVRTEASRRMQALVGARDAAHLSQIIQNAQREAERLNIIRAGIPGVIEPRAWTAEETARAAALWAADQAIEAIRAASNAMEADPPADYTNNARWP